MENTNREELIKGHQSLLEKSGVDEAEKRRLETRLGKLNSQRFSWQTRCKVLEDEISSVMKKVDAVRICKYKISATLSRHCINSQQPLIQKRLSRRLKWTQLSAQMGFYKSG